MSDGEGGGGAAPDVDVEHAVPSADIDATLEKALEEANARVVYLKKLQTHTRHATFPLRVAFAAMRNSVQKVADGIDQLSADEVAHVKLAQFTADSCVAVDMRTLVADLKKVTQSQQTLERAVGQAFSGLDEPVVFEQLFAHRNSSPDTDALRALLHENDAVALSVEQSPTSAVVRDYANCIDALRRSFAQLNPGTSIKVAFGNLSFACLHLLERSLVLEYEVLYDPCRGGKQFEDRCHGCRGCGPEERRIKHKNWFTVIKKGEKGPPAAVADRFGRFVHPTQLDDAPRWSA